MLAAKKTPKSPRRNVARKRSNAFVEWDIDEVMDLAARLRD